MGTSDPSECAERTSVQPITRTLPDQIRDDEREYIRKRRIGAKLTSSAGDSDGLPLVGMALSGGGIRSATFSLGVLQCLARNGVLRLADYLCTVSGGGYIGSCLTSLMTLNPAPKPWDRDCPKSGRKRRFDMGDEMPLLDRDQIHHLRKHGDFLILRKGLVRTDVLRAVGSIVLGIVCTLALFLTVLLIAVGLLFLFGTWLGGDGLWTKIMREGWPAWSVWSESIPSIWPIVGWMAVFGVAAAAVLLTLCVLIS